MRGTMIAAMMLLGTCGGAWAGENLIQNGGFEEVKAEAGRSGNPFEKWGGWKFEGDAQMVSDKDVKHGGAASALLTSTGPCKIAINQKVKTEPGWYKLTMWVKGANLTENAGRAVKFGFEAKGGASVKDVLPPGTYGWRKVERVYHLTDANADSALYIYLYGSGRLNVDDVTLEKLEGDGQKEGMALGDPEAAAPAGEKK